MSQVCELPLKNATSEEIRVILKAHRVVAVVGASAKEDRPSYEVARFLWDHGYRVVPVNPSYPEVLGLTCYPSLSDVPKDVRIEIVDIFRKPEAVPEIVEEAIRIGAKVIWMQEGIVHNAAADHARAHGLQVVMNRCMKKEYIAHYV